jgi:hypothetical protein
MPTHLDAAPIDGARYRQRFVALDAAFTAFTQFRTAHAEEIKQAALAGLVGDSVDDFFAASKLLRSLLDAPKPDRQLYLTKVNDFSTKFDDLLQRSAVASKPRAITRRLQTAATESQALDPII